MDKVISKDGTSIAFDKTGTGPALVLVDGAFCFREYGTSPELVPLLSHDFTVFSYDRRGRGNSTDTGPYSVDREIEDLMAVISKTGEIPFICGFSSGAGLVLRAISKGVQAKKIVLFEPPYIADSQKSMTPPAEAGMKLEKFVNQGDRGSAVKYFMTKVMGMPRSTVFLFKLFGKPMWEKNESVAHTLPYEVSIMGNYSIPDGVTSVTMPTLVTGGDKSPERLRNAVKTLFMTIPQSQIRFLKGQKHNISMKILAPYITDFFKNERMTLG